MRGLTLVVAAAVAMVIGQSAASEPPPTVSQSRSDPCLDPPIPAFERLARRTAMEIRYPVREVEQLGEGWVHVIYTISANATAANIETVDAIGPKSYSTAVQAAILSGRFETALRAGQPIEHHGLGLSVTFAIEGHNRAGVHSRFNDAFDRAKRLRSEKKFGDALAIDREALKQSLNMYELATLSFGQAYSYLGLNDNQRALVAIRHATIDGSKFLQQFSRPHAQAMLALLEALNNHPRAALCAYGELLQTFPKFSPDAQLSTLMDTARAQLSGNEPVRTAIELIESERDDVPNRWAHILTRRTFAFEGIAQSGSGRFRQVCNAAIQEDRVVAGRTWTVDPANGECTLYFYGDPGFRFTLVER